MGLSLASRNSRRVASGVAVAITVSASTLHAQWKLHLETDDARATIEARVLVDDGDEAWRLVCRLPCELTSEPGVYYRVAGSGIVASRPFRAVGDASYRASTTSESTRTAFEITGFAGLAVAAVSGVILGLGGSQLPTPSDPNEPTKPSVAIYTLAGGLGVAAIGFAVFALQGPTKIFDANGAEPSFALFGPLSMSPSGLRF